jgi:CopG family nickel-responsive transcriptional regulator
MERKLLSRFSISMEGGLAAQLDSMAKARGYANRSQAVSDMVRAQLVEHEAEAGDREIVGSISMVYDHHKRNVQALLTDIQHAHQQLITAGVHVHLDHRNCMEVLVVRGPSGEVRKLAERLLGAKGVKHVKLTVTATEPDGRTTRSKRPRRPTMPRRKGSPHAHG